MNLSLKRIRINNCLNDEIINCNPVFFSEENQKHVSFKKKQEIFCEGNSYDGIYFILSGRVKIYKKASNDKNLLIYMAEKGDCLGYDCSLMNISEYSSSAVALTAVETSFVPGNVFDNILKNNVRIKKYFLELFAIDIQNINQKMLDLAYKPVRGRLADALLVLGDKINSRETDQQINLTRNELANYIGSVRETTTRLLSEFKKEQLIEMNRDFIQVLNHDKLNYISRLYK